MTQAYLASRANVARLTVIRAEAGENVSLDVKRKLLEALKIDPEDPAAVREVFP